MKRITTFTVLWLYYNNSELKNNRDKTKTMVSLFLILCTTVQAPWPSEVRKQTRSHKYLAVIVKCLQVAALRYYWCFFVVVPFCTCFLSGRKMHKKHRVRLERGDHRMHVAWSDITSLQGQRDKDRTNAMTLVTSTWDGAFIQSPLFTDQVEADGRTLWSQIALP